MSPSALLALTLLLSPTTVTAQSTRQEVPARPDAATKALAAIEDATRAVKAWRAEAASAATLDVASARRIRSALSDLQREIDTLGAGAQRAAPPEAAEESEQRRAWAAAKVWVDDIRALGVDAAARRATALEAVRAALASGDSSSQWAALIALRQVGDVEYDKPSMRPLVLPFARRATGAMAPAALYALLATAHEPDDLALVHAAWSRSPGELDDSILHLLASFGGGRIEGRSEEIALEHLVHVEHVNRELNGLWGARVGPRLEARVLELARSEDRGLRHGAIYFGLSTFAEKSEAVVDALIATLGESDPNNSQRALWGLGHGVPEALRPKVVDALVELHASRSDRSTRDQCARIVRQYGGDAALARLQR